jgi:hypothetical protein
MHQLGNTIATAAASEFEQPGPPAKGTSRDGRAMKKEEAEAGTERGTAGYSGHLEGGRQAVLREEKPS